MYHGTENMVGIHWFSWLLWVVVFGAIMIFLFRRSPRDNHPQDEVTHVQPPEQENVTQLETPDRARKKH